MNIDLKRSIAREFSEKFKEDSILIFSPGRINIIGEHTDYNDGFVLPGAIDKGIISAMSKSSNIKSVAVASDLNETFEFDLKNIQPLSNGNWRNYILGVVGEIQKIGKYIGNFNIVFGGDIPNGSGMSSSAALENSVVFGLNDLFDLGLTKTEMIYISQKAEHNYVGVNCGIMDQYASMFGQKNHLLFLDCRNVEASQYFVDLKEYELILINTNVKHSLSDSAYNDRRAVCERTAALLGKKALRDVSEYELKQIRDQLSETDYQKALYVIQEIARTKLSVVALLNNDIKTLGKLIYDSHYGLQHQYKVSCQELDFLVDQSKQFKQVLGARMMGGGFGGCTINLIHKSAISNFIEDIKDAYLNKFNNHCSVYHVKLSNGTSKI